MIDEAEDLLRDVFAVHVAEPAQVRALPALQRRLNGATSVGQLFARASVEAASLCGFERGIVLSISEGRLTTAGMEAIEEPASDALRRRSLANPVPILSGSEEADVIRRADGLRGNRRQASCVTKEALSLDHYAMAAVVPEARTVALLVLDRPGAEVGERDQAAVDLFAHILGLAVMRVVTRLRMQELATELRHLTASAHALMHEALEAPITLTSDQGHGPVFVAAGNTTAPEDMGKLLSDRELEIAALMVEGRSNREIGEELHLSPETVKTHVARLVRKLGATNRVDFVARYVTMGRAQ